MEKLFLTVLSLSATTAVVILLVLPARLALRRAPKVFSYALWAVVLLRLLCPFAIRSPWSLVPTVRVEPADESLSMVEIDFYTAEVTIRVDDPPVGRAQPAAPVVTGESPDIPGAPVPAVTALPGLLSAAGVVWLAGAAALLGYSAVSLFLLRRRLVGAAPLTGERNVLLADHIPSPFVLGLLRPKIYLPSDFPEGERDYILLHERTHIRRLDHVTRALAWLALAVHWFNPLVWLAFHLAGKDMEMSCDEAVLRKMGRDVRADYSTSLLRLSVEGRLPAGPLAFGGGDPQGRIKNVLRYKKPALWVVALGLLAVLSACAALATSTSRRAGDLDPPEASAAYSLDDTGSAVVISGLDCDGALWQLHGPRVDSRLFTNSVTALGCLTVTNPRFLGGLFKKATGTITTYYYPDAAFQLFNAFEGYTFGSAELKRHNFLVDLNTGIGTHKEISGFPSRTVPIDEDDILEMGRTLAQIIQGAADYYARVSPQAAASNPPPEEGPLPFDQPLGLWFGSGAGAWRTILTLRPDGSFEGEYTDSDMGSGGPGYRSTEYVCWFHGRFGNIAQASAASWSMTLEELTLDTGHPIGEEWIENIRTSEGGSYNLRYISSDPYGLDGLDGKALEPGARFMFYTPEAKGCAPGDELYGMQESGDYDSMMYQFWGWWPDKHAWTPDSTLGSWGLCNMETGYGFFDLSTWGIMR